MRICSYPKCLIAAACLFLHGGVAQADLYLGGAYSSESVSLNEAATLRSTPTKFQFARTLRPNATTTTENTATTSATLLVLSGNLDTTAAISTPTAPFNIGDGGLLGDDSVTRWPSGRYTETIQLWDGSSGSVTGSVSEVPLPPSVLLGVVGLGIVGLGRTRFAPRG